ncbi:hypothetical protein M0N77_04005 [Psychrobacter sp. AH5]|uniref:hypothetical protein n=1 Tax=Psychrobacter sp. AH5 TaxID=2937433 RepID=UPI0033404C01
MAQQLAKLPIKVSVAGLQRRVSSQSLVDIMYNEFSPFWAIPDQIRHRLTSETPLWLILAVMAVLLTAMFTTMWYFTNSFMDDRLSVYNTVI